MSDTLSKIEKRTAYILILPAVFLVFSIILFPIFANVWISFKEVGLKDIRIPEPRAKKIVKSIKDNPDQLKIIYKLRNSSLILEIRDVKFQDKLPKNIKGENWVVYTGTHDNSTSVSWWENLDYESKKRIKDEYKFSENPSWDLIEIGMETNANLFIAPLQDLLSLDDSSRLNKPGTTKNNWKWKLNCPLEEIENNIKMFSELGNNFGRTLI